MRLGLTSLSKAVISLRRALESVEEAEQSGTWSPALGETLRAGVMHTFEFTYELCWKFMARWLAANLSRDAVAGISRRALYRMAAENGLMEDVGRWMEYHEVRNLTVHAYNEAVAGRVVAMARVFLSDAELLVPALEARND